MTMELESQYRKDRDEDEWMDKWSFLGRTTQNCKDEKRTDGNFLKHEYFPPKKSEMLSNFVCVFHNKNYTKCNIQPN